MKLKQWLEENSPARVNLDIEPSGVDNSGSMNKNKNVPSNSLSDVKGRKILDSILTKEYVDRIDEIIEKKQGRIKSIGQAISVLNYLGEIYHKLKEDTPVPLTAQMLSNIFIKNDQ